MYTSRGAIGRRAALAALLAAGMILGCSSWALADPGPDPHTFSLDKASPSGVDPADLLNPNAVPPPTTQVLAANLGLLLGDELDALSGGADAVRDLNIVFFSVDRLSMGAVPGPLPPWDVLNQALLSQQAGDVFVSTNAAGGWSPPVGVNMLRDNQGALGEIPSILPTVPNPGPMDRLDAMAFEEFDLTGDGAHDLPVYFSLDLLSPSLVAPLSAADILLSPVGGGFVVFAPAGAMGLTMHDDLDALALLDLGVAGRVDPGVDLALFSLAPGSPTLALLGASPADVFITAFNNASAVRYPAGSLGLLFEDNVDALEVQIPEPVCLSFLLPAVAGLLSRRRRR